MAQCMTVTGPVPVESLGLVLPHEHIFVDAAYWVRESDVPRKRALLDAPVEITNIGELQRDPQISRQNLLIDDYDMVLAELKTFRAEGGGTVVDVSPPEVGRHPEKLLSLAQESGVNIVMGTSRYVAATHPPELKDQSVAEIAQWMVDEVREGIDGTGVRAGIIGEIGVSSPIHPDEVKVLQAGAVAQRETGLGLSIHCPCPNRTEGVAIVKILEDAGAQIDRVVLDHMDHSIDEHAYHRELAKTGALLEFDRFGCEFYWQTWDDEGLYIEPRDIDRVDVIVALIEEGYGEQILISHDTANKIQFHPWGGNGWAHIARHAVTYFKARGVSDEMITQITERNPARILGSDLLG